MQVCGPYGCERYGVEIGGASCLHPMMARPTRCAKKSVVRVMAGPGSVGFCGTRAMEFPAEFEDALNVLSAAIDAAGGGTTGRGVGGSGGPHGRAPPRCQRRLDRRALPHDMPCEFLFDNVFCNANKCYPLHPSMANMPHATKYALLSLYIACSHKEDKVSASEVDEASATAGSSTASGVDDSGPTEPTGTVPPDTNCRPPQNGDQHCSILDSEEACNASAQIIEDHSLRGECHWVEVLRVNEGTCNIAKKYSTCIFTPVYGDGCGPPSACGIINFGIFGAETCDGYLDIIVNPPESVFCEDPLIWTACTADRSECKCFCDSAHESEKDSSR